MQGNVSNQVLLLDIDQQGESSLITEQPPLIHARLDHASCATDIAFYVFGGQGEGFSNFLNTFEKLDIDAISDRQGN